VNEPDGLAHELVGTTTVIRLVGDIDMTNADALQARSEQLCAGALAVVVDLEATTYLDSAGIRLLDAIARSCGVRGIPLAALASSDSIVRRVVELTLPTLDLIDDVHSWAATRPVADQGEGP
jgi:anti-sigma B factor antagonist